MRLFEGYAVVWDRYGKCTAGVVRIVPRSITLPRDVDGILALDDHKGPEVGRVVEAEVDNEGIWTTIELDGIPDDVDELGVSPELVRATVHRDEITAGVLHRVALVDVPAFGTTLRAVRPASTPKPEEIEE